MKLLRILPIGLAVIGLGCSGGGDEAPTGGSSNILSLSVSDVEILEGRSVNFTVRLSASSSSDVTFAYATSDGSATSGQFGDYTGVSGDGSIVAGQTSTIISVATQDDGSQELPEMFSITLSSPVNATIGSGNASATIWDNDGVRFSSQVRPLIQSSCLAAGCHGVGSSSGGFSFGSADYTSVRNARGSQGFLITGQQANRSNLYLKLLDPPPFGARMPSGGPFLPQGSIDMIRDWINQGAQDN